MAFPLIVPHVPYVTFTMGGNVATSIVLIAFSSFFL
jgi:hypothetical protein